ncbi:MAG: metal-dependent hydrolase [Candidatus Promineifilaceae bacterium]|jgi:L-ascorbate metabolism protein UlaG (beta-lactamase superfamily)
MGIKITWHGHATYSVEIDGVNIVVDPFFAGNNPSCVRPVDEVEADFILQTHAHGDHIGDTVELAKATGAQVISNFEIANWINKHGYENTWAMNTGGSYEFPFGRVKMTPALHSSGLPDGTYGGDPGGYLIFAKDATLYFAGDTALFSDMTLIGNAGIDVAVIPTGDNFTMGPDDAFASLSYLRPKVVIPCHYDTFPPIAQDMDTWAERVNVETDVRAVVLDVEESFEL